MAAPAYAQVAQMPPRRLTKRSIEDVRRRQEIMRGKRATDAPRVAPRVQEPSIPLSDLQLGLELPGTSNTTADLCKCVGLLVRQYLKRGPEDFIAPGPTTESPALDTEMLEEDRLAWQQLATSARLRE